MSFFYLEYRVVAVEKSGVVNQLLSVKCDSFSRHCYDNCWRILLNSVSLGLNLSSLLLLKGFKADFTDVCFRWHISISIVFRQLSRIIYLNVEIFLGWESSKTWPNQTEIFSQSDWSRWMQAERWALHYRHLS